MRWQVGVMVGALALGGGSGAHGQGLVEAYERASFGGALSVARPVGEFQQFVDVGGGLNIFGAVNVVPELGLGLRADGTFLVYGSETRPVPFSQTIPTILLDVTTTNSIVNMGLGPQVNLGRGPVIVYGYGLIGFSYFSTVTSLRDVDGYESIAETTNFDDTTLSFSGGGGLKLRLSGGAKPAYLDLGVTVLQNGEAEYLREGSIREANDGSVFYTPIQSDANLVNFRLGVSVSVF